MWEGLIGTWSTDGSHPLLPGAKIVGRCSFERMLDEKFLIWRAHYDHRDIPDAFSVISVDGTMHYFDTRGVARVYTMTLDGDMWQFERNDPGFLQRFTGHFTDEDTIVGHGEMARDGGDWEPDLALTYRRM